MRLHFSHPPTHCPLQNPQMNSHVTAPLRPAARLVFTAPAAGVYTVEVDAYPGEDSGDFDVTVEYAGGSSDSGPCTADGLTLRENSGTVSFSEGYENDQSCRWSLQCVHGESIELEFEMMVRPQPVPLSAPTVCGRSTWYMQLIPTPLGFGDGLRLGQGLRRPLRPGPFDRRAGHWLLRRGRKCLLRHGRPRLWRPRFWPDGAAAAVLQHPWAGPPGLTLQPACVFALSSVCDNWCSVTSR